MLVHASRLGYFVFMKDIQNGFNFLTLSFIERSASFRIIYTLANVAIMKTTS